MKSVFFGLLLSLTSFGAMAESYLEDSARLSDCGGRVELRSYENQGSTKYALQFEGVRFCGKVKLSSGKTYSLIDDAGRFVDRNFTLSNDAIALAKRGQGLNVLVTSNSGAHQDSVNVKIRGAVLTPAVKKQFTASFTFSLGNYKRCNYEEIQILKQNGQQQALEKCYDAGFNSCRFLSYTVVKNIPQATKQKVTCEVKTIIEGSRR